MALEVFMSRGDTSLPSFQIAKARLRLNERRPNGNYGIERYISNRKLFRQKLWSLELSFHIDAVHKKFCLKKCIFSKLCSGANDIWNIMEDAGPTSFSACVNHSNDLLRRSESVGINISCSKSLLWHNEARG